MEGDRAVAGIARDQHGLVTRRQVLEAGLSERQVDRRCAQGRLEVVHRGVYAVAGTPRTAEQRALAACLASGGVASHRTAGALWDLGGVERGWTEVTVASKHTRLLDRVVVHRTRDLRPDHVTTRHGVPVTKPHRTLVDLGAIVPRWSVREACDDALARKLVSMAGLVTIWRDVARPGRAGSGALRWILEEVLPRPDASVLERQMLRLHRDHGLPEPEVEFTIRTPTDRFVGRVDFAHPGHRLVLETDGYRSHSRVDAFVRDRVRDRRLHALGWTVLRFVWFEVIHTPATVADEIRQFLTTSESA